MYIIYVPKTGFGEKIRGEGELNRSFIFKSKKFVDVGSGFVSICTTSLSCFGNLPPSEIVMFQY